MEAVDLLRWKLRVLRIVLSVLAISPILVFIPESVSCFSSCAPPSKGRRREGAGTKSSSTWTNIWHTSFDANIFPDLFINIISIAISTRRPWRRGGGRLRQWAAAASPRARCWRGSGRTGRPPGARWCPTGWGSSTPCGSIYWSFDNGQVLELNYQEHFNFVSHLNQPVNEPSALTRWDAGAMKPVDFQPCLDNIGHIGWYWSNCPTMPRLIILFILGNIGQTGWYWSNWPTMPRWIGNFGQTGWRLMDHTPIDVCTWSWPGSRRASCSCSATSMISCFYKLWLWSQPETQTSKKIHGKVQSSFRHQCSLFSLCGFSSEWILLPCQLLQKWLQKMCLLQLQLCPLTPSPQFCTLKLEINAHQAEGLVEVFKGGSSQL